MKRFVTCSKVRGVFTNALFGHEGSIVNHIYLSPYLHTSIV